MLSAHKILILATFQIKSYYNFPTFEHNGILQTCAYELYHWLCTQTDTFVLLKVIDFVQF